VAKVRERLALSKETMHRVHMERFTLKKLNGVEGKEQLSTSYKILSNILLSRLSPHIDEIIGGRQCGFRCNRLTIDQICTICEILRKNGSTMRQYISYS
jgi:hypothetical protein